MNREKLRFELLKIVNENMSGTFWGPGVLVNSPELMTYYAHILEEYVVNGTVADPFKFTREVAEIRTLEKKIRKKIEKREVFPLFFVIFISEY